MTTERFDAIIIGAGQSGGPLSSALGEAGWKTAILEREHAGGTCVNTGCTPTKTMVASARAAYVAMRGADYGVNASGIEIDLEIVRQRKRDIVEQFRAGSRSSIEAAANVELIEGEATFTGRKSISVRLNEGGTRHLEAATIVINAGGRPRMPEIRGLESVEPLDSTTIMELATVPGHLVIVGGGPIALEFGQMFRRFGSNVTLLVRGPHILADEDPDISDVMTDLLLDDGIRIRSETEVSEFIIREGQKIARLDVNGASDEIAFDQILIAAGRVPNSDVLNLDCAGIETAERGYIVVDDRLQTSVEGVYALGDINGGPALTHVSYDDFRIMRDNLLHGLDRSRAGRLVPYTIFTDPQLGRVGVTEAEARDAGYDVQVFKMPMTSVARALEVDETRGVMRALVDRPTGKILGASMLGIEGGEIAGAVQIAMMGELPYTALRDGMFSHPTLMESLNNLFSSPVDEQASAGRIAEPASP